MYPAFRPFRLQPPAAVSGFWFGFVPEPTARSADRIPFGDPGVTWASPFPSGLATTTGRIEFVILRTSRSPPVALHPLSRGRSYFRLRSSSRDRDGLRAALHARARGRQNGTPGTGVEVVETPARAGAGSDGERERARPRAR